MLGVRSFKGGQGVMLKTTQVAALVWLLLARACVGTSAQAAEPQAPTGRLKHLVVIFQENHSFDSYFATYPVAANPPGQPAFSPRPGTPSVNGLTETLLRHNPNPSNPFRNDPLHAFSCDQDHEYTAEQRARNGGLMNRFVRFAAQGPTDPRQFCHRNSQGHWDTAMGYFDGNTVTALWNYAQHFALSDNFFATTAGQSTRGALNLTAGDTFGVLCGPNEDIYGDVPPCGGPAASVATPAPTSGILGTLNNDVDPYWDICSEPSTAALSGRNVGDLLTAAGVTWGWFQGGFALSPDGTCASSHLLEAYDQAVGIDPTTDPLPSRTTSLTIIHSSTSPPPPTRGISRRALWKWWARRIRPIICTTSPGSGRQPTSAISRLLRF